MALTIKQENFCLSYIETGNASEAYRRSYDAGKMKGSTINRNANALLSDSKIAARIDELRKPAVLKAQVTLESHLNDLKALRNAAVSAEQFSAAINAEIHRGKVCGLYSDRQQEDKPKPRAIRIIKAEEMTIG